MALFNIEKTTTVIGKVGPLQALFTDSFAQNLLQYPDDLNTETTNNTKKPHVVKFFINVPQNSKYITGTSGSGLTLNTTIPGGTEPPLNIINRTLGVSLSNQQMRLAGAISLYMPDTVNMGFDLNYDGENLSEYSIVKAGQIGESIFDKMRKNIKDKGFLSMFSGTGPEVTAALQLANDGKLPFDTVLKGQGVAINPQIQLLFRAVGLRTFQMEFMFSPKTQAEALTIQEIIQTFRFHAAPEIAGDANSTESGLFFIVPSTFNIQFLFQGQENPFIQRIGQTVLESVNVDYAPNGWSTFYDGSPTQTRLTLQFKETDILDKSKIELGF